MYDTESIDMVGVVGAGAMGNGIAQVTTMADYDVVMRDLRPEYVECGLSAIGDNLSRFVSEEKLTGDGADTAKMHVARTTELTSPGNYDLVVEAAVENMDMKRDIFADLDDIVPEGVVLATNTNALSVATITAATECPELVMGLHFMNPVPIMKGAEVVRGEKTDNDVVVFAHDFSKAFDEEAWESDDKPGFVTDYILMPWFNEDIRTYDEGVASKKGIGRGMALGTNVPMGPLTLADHIGLDICLDTSETLFKELGDRYELAYLLKRKVTAGGLGKKTGRGFCEYD